MNSLYDNPQIEMLMLELADHLKNRSGKMQYGYLKKDDKIIIDEIVNELEKEPNIAELYRLWYEKRSALFLMYQDNVPDKPPLSTQKDFKTIKNAVIKETLKINEINAISNTENIFNKIDNENKGHISKKDLSTGVTNLLYRLSKIFEEKHLADDSGKFSLIDKKLRKKISEKKQTQGLKM